MPTSSYMPDLVVEIAFNAGFLTPAASYVWTDVSSYVELARGVNITVGRGDERSTADANQLSLTLDNTDGRFTAGRSTSPYYPNVKLNRPIRVTATPVDGAAATRFLGFINEWPTEWPDGTAATASATITASSRLSRLGYVAALKSVVEQTILADSPAAYYTLGEPAGATQANDSSGNAANPLTLNGDPAIPVVFGNATGPPTDGMTAAQFAGGQYLSALVSSTASVPITVEAFFKVDAIPTTERTLIHVQGLATGLLSLSIAPTTGVIRLFAADTTSGNVCDGQWHHLAFLPTSSQIYIDGALAYTNGSFTALQAASLHVGGSPLADATGIVQPPFIGAIAHVALWNSALTGSQVAAHATAGRTGFAGDTTSARLVRYAGYAGIPSAEVSTETGQTTVQHIDTTGKQAAELMRTMEVAEGGVLFDNRDGVLTFHNRAHRLTSSALFSLDMAQHQVEAGYVPQLDRSTLANDITATDVSGQYSARVFDTTSITDHGYATMSIETASQDDDEPLFLASWALYTYKQPLPRVPSLAVDALAQVGKTPSCTTVMSANVGSKITVANRPTQDASSSASFFVEGYTETYGPESLTITFNVSPSSPDDTTLVIGDATRGFIGTNPVAL